MKKYTKAQRNHDIKVGIFGICGAICLFLFSMLLAALGPYLEDKTNNEESEDSSMFIEESSLDDIRDKMEDVAVEINGKQYILIDTAVDILQEYLEEEDE